MYRNLGYFVDSPAQVLLPAARSLVAKFGHNFDTVFSDAFREAGLSDRRFMKDLTRDDLIQLSKSVNFPRGSAQLRELLHLVYAIMSASGWGDYRPAVIRYNEQPLMPLDEVLTEALNDHLEKGMIEVGRMWPEKCNVETFRTHFAPIVKRMALLWEYRPYIVDKLERYVGDLLYRMKTMEISPTGLDQFDRSLVALMVSEKEPLCLVYTDAQGSYSKLAFPDAKDADPLIGPEIARFKSAVQPGPWLRFTRLLSNMDARELAYIVSPILADLPLVTGYMIPVGPFHDMDLNVHSRVMWGDAEQFAGFVERIMYPISPENSSMTQRLGFRTPAHRVWQGSSPPHYDWPTLEVINDTDEQGSPLIKYSWYSPTQQRMVHTVNGATMHDLITDLAATHKELGETPCPVQNIHDFKFVDLNHESMLDRRVVHTGGDGKRDADDAPILRERIYETLWYFEGGRNLMSIENLDVTPLYNKIGNVSFKPALSDYFTPSRTWFLQADQTAIDFIVGRLQLNVYDARRSVLALTISHNVAVYERLTGTKVKWDVEEVIRAMHALES